MKAELGGSPRGRCKKDEHRAIVRETAEYFDLLIPFHPYS